jgi:hypothetical protein
MSTKKAGWIVGAIMAVLVVLAGVVSVVVISRFSTDSGTTTAGTSSGEAADSGAPDANVLAQRIVAAEVKYGTTAVFDACAVMPRTALASAGISNRVEGHWEHQHIPTSVSPDKARITKAGSHSYASSKCGYPINDDGMGSITLEILQSPFNSRYAVDQPKDNEVESSASGLKVMTWNPDAGMYFARIGKKDTNFTATVSGSRLASDYSGFDAKTVFTKVVEVVAANLAKGPVERAKYEFTGRYKDVPNACDVVSADLFGRLTGSEDSGLALYEPASADELEMSYANGTTTNFVEQKCTRHTSDQVVGVENTGKSLTVEFRTFRTDERARLAHQRDCDPNNPSAAALGEPMAVDEQVGDATPCVRSIDKPNYVFLVGRTSVHLIGNRPWTGERLAPFSKQFTPIAKTVADEVRRQF